VFKVIQSRGRISGRNLILRERKHGSIPIPTRYVCLSLSQKLKFPKPSRSAIRPLLSHPSPGKCDTLSLLLGVLEFIDSVSYQERKLSSLKMRSIP